MALRKDLGLVERKDLNKQGKEYTYFELNYIKTTGETVAIKRIFLSDLEKEALNLLQNNDK